MKKQVFIIEDERIIAEDIKTILNNLGYEVLGIVDSGKKALKFISKKRPDIVLMDIILKGNMNGIETGKIINKNLNIPVIYITAYTDEEILQQAKITEPFGFIVKPFDDRELKSTIEISLYKHKMELELKEKEKKYRSLVENISDVIYEIDKNGKIKYISPVIEYMSGYKTTQLIGNRLIDYVYKEDIPSIKKYLKNAIAGKSEPVEFRLLSRYGDAICVRTKLQPSTTDKNSKQLRGIFVDITEHKRLEKEFLKSQKLQSISVLAGGIAHSFDNLLTAILGNVSLAKTHTKNEHGLHKFLDDIETASLRAKDLTTQLLIFSERGTPAKKSVPLKELIKSSIELTLGGSNIICKCSLPADIWNIEIDREQMKQVFNNILINADQSMPDGGTVKIWAENLLLEKDNKLSLDVGKYVKITFKDQGMGISPEHLSKIFDPYFSTKKKGSGLGLSVAYTVLKNHEGLISVDSKLGKSTTVTLYIPSSTKKDTKRKSRNRPQHKPTARILVMDDEKIVRDTVGMMLKSLGYKADFAVNGEEAIKKYRKVQGTSESYDAVIMDLTVPGGMGGQETIENLRKIGSGVKAIVSSGYSNNQVMSNYEKYGFNDVIAKPYRIQELKEILQKLLK